MYAWGGKEGGATWMLLYDFFIFSIASGVYIEEMGRGE
jgi:SNF family Na+-dependent transporter